MTEEFEKFHDYSWGDTRMTFCIKYPSEKDSLDTGTEVKHYIVGIERVVPRTESPHDPIDSIQEYNQGLRTRQKRYFFTLTTKEKGSGFVMLMALQEGDRYFDIVIAPDTVVRAGTLAIATTKQLWGLVKAMYVGCKVNGSSATYEIADIPRRDFDGIAIRVGYDMWDDSGMIGELFGDGFSGPAKTDAELGLTV